MRRSLSQVCFPNPRVALKVYNFGVLRRNPRELYSQQTLCGVITVILVSDQKAG